MDFKNNTQSTRDNKTELLFSDNSLSRETKRKISAFEQGDIAALDSVDIITIIAQHIFNLYNKGDMRFALILLENLGDWSRSDNIEYRERSLMALSLITEKVLEDDNEDFLEALSRLLIRWLKFETEYLAGFEFICLQLRKMVQRMLKLGLWYQTEDLIVILSKIKKGTIRKSKVFTQVITRIHSSLAEKEFLKELTETYVDEQNDRRDVAGTLLVHFGDRSAFHLLFTLCNCPHKNERYHLIEILPATGSEAIPALVAQLRKKPPWYVVRNIILILSKLSDPSLFYLVRPYMTHRDTRVQQEVIDCARRMNGNKMVARLLDALEVCYDKLKPQIVRHLGLLEDERIGAAFSNLFENTDSFDQHAKDEIIRETCRHINGFPSQKAMDSLHHFLMEKGTGKEFSADTIAIAENAFRSMQKSMQSPNQPEQLSPQNIIIEVQEHQNDKLIVDTNSDPAREAPLSLTFSDYPGSIQLIADDYSEEEDWNTFQLAEDWLTRTIESGNASPAMRHHLTLRNDFYQKFNEEEFSAFISFLARKSYKQGETIVEIGDVHSNLFFIDSGIVSLNFQEDSSVFYIPELKEGDIFGNDVFMSGSEWDVSLVACTDAEIYMFDQEQLLKMQLRFPDLALKILDYCKQHDFILSLLRMAEERRLPKQDDNIITFTGNSGEVIGDIELVDISTVGFCFSLHLPKGFGPTLFADKKLLTFFSSDSDHKETVESHVVGLQFIESKNSKLYILAKFLQQKDLNGLTCTRVGLQ